MKRVTVRCLKECMLVLSLTDIEFLYFNTTLMVGTKDDNRKIVNPDLLGQSLEYGG